MLGIILQARMDSSRLPGKVIRKIGNKNILEYIFYRLGVLKHEAGIVLATSDSKADNIIEELCRNNNIRCFRGSLENVLERYYLCAKKYNFDHIVRLTGDNPFVDIEELDRLIDLHLNTKADYSSSINDLPVGIGAEIFTFESLERCYMNGKEKHHLEHVDEYILDNPGQFKISELKVPPEKCRHDILLTVDTESDYQKASFIVENSRSAFINTQEAIRLAQLFKN
jgi:spore coat polysaccharide biosynthesis protein SpsF